MAIPINYVIGTFSLLSMIIIGVFFRNKMPNLKKYGILGIFLITLIGNSSIIAPIGPFASVIGGSIYPPWLVGIAAACGSVVGEILMYNIGGIAESQTIENKKWYDTIKYFMEKYGFPTIVVVTSIPNPVTNFSAIAAGSIGYPLWKFLIAAWIGNWIQFTLCASLGSLIKIFPFLKNVSGANLVKK